MTIPLVTIAEAKEFIGMRATNTDHDASVKLFTMLATKMIEQATGRAFAKGATSELFNTPETYLQGSELRVSYALAGFNVDMGQPFEVYYDERGVFGADTALTALDDYIVDYTNGILHLKYNTDRAFNSLKVVYTAGYDIAGTPPTLSASAPEDLKHACLYQTSYMRKRAKPDNVGMTGDVGMSTNKSGTGAAQWNTPNGLCAEAVNLAGFYRRVLTGRG